MKISIRPNIKEEYIFIGIVSILSVFILIFFFRMGIPNFNRYRKLVKEANKRDKELSARKATIVQIDRLKQEINKTESEYKSFAQKVILEPGSLEAAKAITNIAEGLNIDFISLQPLALQRIDLYTPKETENKKVPRKAEKAEKAKIDFFIWEIPVRIKIRGNYANLMHFIKKIERGSRYIKIRNIQIQKDPASPFVHNASITVSMFSLPSKEREN